LKNYSIILRHIRTKNLRIGLQRVVHTVYILRSLLELQFADIYMHKWTSLGYSVESGNGESRMPIGLLLNCPVSRFVDFADNFSCAASSYSRTVIRPVESLVRSV